MKTRWPCSSSGPTASSKGTVSRRLVYRTPRPVRRLGRPAGDRRVDRVCAGARSIGATAGQLSRIARPAGSARRSPRDPADAARRHARPAPRARRSRRRARDQRWTRGLDRGACRTSPRARSGFEPARRRSAPRPSRRSRQRGQGAAAQRHTRAASSRDNAPPRCAGGDLALRVATTRWAGSRAPPTGGRARPSPRTGPAATTSTRSRVGAAGSARSTSSKVPVGVGARRLGAGEQLLPERGRPSRTAPAPPSPLGALAREDEHDRWTPGGPGSPVVRLPASATRSGPRSGRDICADDHARCSSEPWCGPALADGARVEAGLRRARRAERPPARAARTRRGPRSPTGPRARRRSNHHPAT